MNERHSPSDPNLQGPNITWLEIIAMELIFFLVPMHMVVRQYFQNGKIWQRVDPFRSTSLAMALMFFFLLVLDTLFRKSYLPMVFGCHQKACRTFRIFHQPFSLCSRCTGILVGTWMSPLLFTLSISPLWFLAGICPLLIDGLVQQYTSYESTNRRRFFTGFLFAPGLMTIMGGVYYGMARVILFLYHAIGQGLGILS